MNYSTKTKGKRGLFAKMILFMLLFLGSSGAWAQTTYEKVTSADGIVDGGKYLIVCEPSGTYAMGALSGNNMSSVSVTKVENKITINSEEVNVVTLEAVNSNYALKCSLTDSYLCNSSSNNLSLGTNKSDSQWSITVKTGGNFEIKSTNNRIMTGNNNNFKVQSSAGNNLYLYKATGGTTPTLDPTLTVTSPVGATFSYTAGATTGEITYTITNPVDGKTVTATADAEWITNVTTDAANNKVTFSVAANETTSQRTAMITLKYGDATGAPTANVTVTQAGTGEIVTPGEVPTPMLKTLTYSTTKGLFETEKSLSEGEGIPYYGCIAVNAAYANATTGEFVDMTDKVSGIIYKFDTKAYTKEEFANHEIVGATTVSTRSALITIDGRTDDNLYLSVIAYHIVDGVRSYSDVATLKYKYTDPGTKKELTLTPAESPFTLELTAANKTSDEKGTLFNDTKTVTITAKDGTTDVTGLSFISRSSNRKLALSHMTKDGTTETTDADNTTLLMDNARRAGVITVLIATPGNETYLPAFVKVNVVLKDNTIGAMAATPDRVYTSIADLRTAGRQNMNQPCVIQFDKTNPATVVAKYGYDDKNIGDAKTIFISDNSGYGLLISYTKGSDNKNEQKFINDNALVPGSSFTGTIYASKYSEGKSCSPALRDISLGTSITIDGTAYETAIVVDHTGEGVTSSDGDVIGAYIPVTNVASVNTIHKTLVDKADNDIQSSYRPYVNTVVSVPGKISKRTDGQYVLVQSPGEYSPENDNYALFISTEQLPGVNLENYLGLEGTFTGLLTKRSNTRARLTITRSAFFEAEQLDEFLLDETLPEGRVADRYNTGALSNKVTAKIHRKGWTTDTWGTICLPFDMTAAEFETTFGQGITALATCNDKVSDAGALSFTELETKDIKAGVPYLIKVNGAITNGTGANETDDNYYATIADREITVPVPSVVTVSHVDAIGDAKNPIVGKTFEFRGLFGKKTVASETNAEGGHDPLAGNQKYQYISTAAGQYLHYLPSGSTAAFAGLRAYLYFPEWNSELNDAANAGSTQNKALTIGIGDGTTGINGIVVKELGDGKVFNLSGQYMGNSAEGLSKGIYIRNGKKFVVK